VIPITIATPCILRLFNNDIPFANTLHVVNRFIFMTLNGLLYINSHRISHIYQLYMGWDSFFIKHQ
jgi:hypothetical protein